MSLFQILHKSQKSKARRGQLNLAFASIQTPAFMPIGTTASVKSLSNAELEKMGYQLILGNTYHLWLRPDLLVLKEAGGLAKFMNWNGNLLTDSGGFQAWSLGKIRKFEEDGVIFRSHLNGEKRFLSPEISMQIQSVLGSQISLVLDEVVNAETDFQTAKSAMERTHRWAVRSQNEFARLQTEEMEETGQIRERFLFAIPQGAKYESLRKQSAEFLIEQNFPGYSIGGVAQGGEPEEVMWAQVLSQTEILEDEKPRHLLGVGTPKDIWEMVTRGIDLFDCVYPTRLARHGGIYVWRDRSRLEYELLKITNKKWETCFERINPNSVFPELQNHSFAYLRHLFVSKELLAYRLATLQNLEFYVDWMEEIRKRIGNDL